MIPLCVPEIRGNEWKYIKECLDTNWVSSAGIFVNKFENEFAKYMNVKSAVVTMNGTSALELALRALNVGDGDEVIVSSMTFISPVNTIRYVGAEPVFVDVCHDTWVMDADKVEEMITPKTRAIMPVHIYGHPVDMDKIMDVANRHSLYVIEDATESLATEYKGKKAGSIGHIGCFSFNGNKLITTGAGGMLITDDENLGERAKYLSTQTKTILENGGFYHEEMGYNFRMPNVLAAMGCAQLENIEEYISSKRKHAYLYNKLLSDVGGIVIPVEREGVKNIYWLYSILVKQDYPISRNKLILKLKEKGIQSRPFFMPVHEMPLYKECRTGDMSITNDIVKKGINLPSSVGLKEDEIIYISNVIRDEVYGK